MKRQHSALKIKLCFDGLRARPAPVCDPVGRPRSRRCQSIGRSATPHDVWADLHGKATDYYPAGDLAKLGAHDLYVSNGAFVSPTIRQYVGRAVNSTLSAFDSNRNLLYAIFASPSGGAPDLVLVDSAGKTLSSLVKLPEAVQSIALSADGHFLYVASNSVAPGSILRYGTVARQVDLQWTLPLTPGQPISGGIISLATPTDSAETVIVLTDLGRAMIYDRDQLRSYDSQVSSRARAIVSLDPRQRKSRVPACARFEWWRLLALARLCDSVVVLHLGRFVGAGRLSSGESKDVILRIVASATVRDLYLGTKLSIWPAGALGSRARRAMCCKQPSTQWTSNGSN